jgi:hypothetical protein
MVLACAAPAPPEIAVERVEGGIELSADRPIRAMSVWTEAGEPVTSRALPVPSPRAAVSVAPPPGASWKVRAELAGGELAERWVSGPLLPVDLAIEAPAGQGHRRVAQGEHVSVWTTPGTAAALVLTALSPSVVTVHDGDSTTEVSLAAPGDRRLVLVPLDRARTVQVSLGAQQVQFFLEPTLLDLQAARDQLEVTGTWLPADPTGRADLTLPADRLVAPLGLVSALGLGWRPAPDQAPLSWQAVGLRNLAPRPLDVVLRAEIRDEQGQLAPAFRSRLRGQEGQPYVTALLRVPAGGEAVVSLPIWLDPAALPARSARYVRHLDVIPLGATAPLHSVSAPLVVVRGAGAAGGAFAAALACSLVGWVGLLRGARGFLQRTSTADLVTIAMFTATAFAVGATLQVVGLVFAALLGPFAPFLMGLPDDAFRVVLLATLLTLMPRPGVLAMATAIGFVMRGLVLGSFHPVDLLYVGSVISTHELCLWLSGVTRRPGWREERPGWRWLRLTLGLAVPNAVCSGLGLATTAILYRMWYADWYVAALVGLPGLCYAAIGCWLAVPIASGLRRIAR